SSCRGSRTGRSSRGFSPAASRAPSAAGGWRRGSATASGGSRSCSAAPAGRRAAERSPGRLDREAHDVTAAGRRTGLVPAAGHNAHVVVRGEPEDEVRRDALPRAEAGAVGVRGTPPGGAADRPPAPVEADLALENEVDDALSRRDAGLLLAAHFH